MKETAVKISLSRPGSHAARPIALTFAALLGLAAMPAIADAGTSTSSLNVTVTVPTSCTITATQVNFGTYDGANANASTNGTAAGTVAAVCTQGTAPTIGLGAGGNALLTQRRLKDATVHYINYNLLQPPTATPGAACNFAAGTAWGDGTVATAGTVLTLTAAPSISARTYNVCGVIPSGQDVPVNGTGNLSYTDAVTATITF